MTARIPTRTVKISVAGSVQERVIPLPQPAADVAEVEAVVTDEPCPAALDGFGAEMRKALLELKRTMPRPVDVRPAGAVHRVWVVPANQRA